MGIDNLAQEKQNAAANQSVGQKIISGVKSVGQKASNAAANVRSSNAKANTYSTNTSALLKETDDAKYAQAVKDTPNRVAADNARKQQVNPTPAPSPTPKPADPSPQKQKMGSSMQGIGNVVGQIGGSPKQDASMTTDSTAASIKGAAPQMQAYDKYTQQAMGASPQEAMQKAQAAAAQTAQAQSDMAVRQAVKSGRTAGAMGGQAALAASEQAAGAYSQGMQQGTQQYFDTTKLGATIGSEMSNRLQSAGQTEAGLKTAAMGAEASKYAADKQAKAAKRASDQNMAGNVIGVLGGVASLFSDRNLKTDIKTDSMADGLDKIKSYTYRYKGGDKNEAGIMAQDLEKTKMAAAVVNTPRGKMVDTRRLSTMNTGALSEHEKRLKAIERAIKGLAEVKRG